MYGMTLWVTNDCCHNHRPGYWSTAWSYSQQENKNRRRSSAAIIWQLSMSRVSFGRPNTREMHVTHYLHGDFGWDFTGIIFFKHIQNSTWHLLWGCSHMNGTEPQWWEGNSGPGNDLMQSGNTWAFVVSCCHLALPGHNELTHWGRENGCHFADDIFNSILLKENVWTPITNSLKFVPKGLINNIPALVQNMAGRRPGDKPLSEPMMVSLLTHICVTRPQWVKGILQIDCYDMFDDQHLSAEKWEWHSCDTY